MKKPGAFLLLLCFALFAQGCACADDDDGDDVVFDDNKGIYDDDDNDDDDIAPDDDDVGPDDDDAGDDDDDTVPEGYKDGDRMPNFTLKDSDGNDVSLKDFKGKVILLDSSAVWCGPCNDDTPKLEKNFHQAYKNTGDGFVVLQLLGENKAGDPPTGQDLAAWIIKHSVTFPVLADPNWGVGDKIGNGFVPFYWLLDQNLVIQKQFDSPGIFFLFQFHDLIKDLLGI